MSEASIGQHPVQEKVKPVFGDKKKNDEKTSGYQQKEGQAEDKAYYHQLELEKIDLNPQQPRRVFLQDDIEKLALSIAKDGVIQPIVVSIKRSTGRYVLVAGERRLRASKKLGLKKIPAVVKQVSSSDLLRLALIENIQRSDLNVVEEAYAVKSLIEEHGYTQEECAQVLSINRSTVSNALRILHLPKKIHEDLVKNKLTMGHAKALLSLEDSAKTLKARDLILERGLNVRQAEWLCKKMKVSSTKKGKDQLVNPNMQYLADSLRSYLRTKVKLVGTEVRGKIEISYFSGSELERVLELISNKIQ